MAYRVEIARRAERDLEELYLWVIERAPQQGAQWFNGFERAICSLDQHPKRCPVAAESFDPGHPVRVLTYGRKPHAYRIFFTVDDDAEIVRRCTCGAAHDNCPRPRNSVETKVTILLRRSSRMRARVF